MSKNGPHDRGPPSHDGLVAGDEVVVSVELVIVDPGLVVVGAELWWLTLTPMSWWLTLPFVVVGSDDVVITPDVVLVR